MKKVEFWVCEENVHSQNETMRSILQKLLRVDESICWVIGSITKLLSLLLKTLTLPFDKSTILYAKKIKKKIPWFFFYCCRLLLQFQHKPINPLLLQASSSTAWFFFCSCGFFSQFFLCNIFHSILSFGWRRRTVFWVRKKT